MHRRAPVPARTAPEELAIRLFTRKEAQEHLLAAGRGMATRDAAQLGAALQQLADALGVRIIVRLDA